VFLRVFALRFARAGLEIISIAIAEIFKCIFMSGRGLLGMIVLVFGDVDRKANIT
jgi:hypothetical protein